MSKRILFIHFNNDTRILFCLRWTEAQSTVALQIRCLVDLCKDALNQKLDRKYCVVLLLRSVSVCAGSIYTAIQRMKQFWGTSGRLVLLKVQPVKMFCLVGTSRRWVTGKLNFAELLISTWLNHPTVSFCFYICIQYVFVLFSEGQ